MSTFIRQGRNTDYALQYKIQYNIKWSKSEIKVNNGDNEMCWRNFHKHFAKNGFHFLLILFFMVFADSYWFDSLCVSVGGESVVGRQHEHQNSRSVLDYNIFQNLEFCAWMEVLVLRGYRQDPLWQKSNPPARQNLKAVFQCVGLCVLSVHARKDVMNGYCDCQKHDKLMGNDVYQ